MTTQVLLVSGGRGHSQGQVGRRSLLRGWEDCGYCCLNTGAWQHSPGQEGGEGVARTCPGGLESGPSARLILTQPVGTSEASCGDQASRTLWQLWRGPMCETRSSFLSRPELGAASSPWALGSGGRSQGWKSRKADEKVGAGESPLCAAFNYSGTHPPEPGHAHLSAQQQGAPGL